MSHDVQEVEDILHRLVALGVPDDVLWDVREWVEWKKRPSTNAPLPLHRTEAGYPRCSTCDGGGCPDCTDPA